MDVAAHDHTPRVLAEAASDVAFLALMDSLACAFKALQDPACTRLLGSLVPGATMAFGARVPGTSYQLDPVQAAFNAWREESGRPVREISRILALSVGPSKAA